MKSQQTALQSMNTSNTLYRKAILQIVGIAVLIAIGILSVFYTLTNQIIQSEEQQTKTALTQLVTIAKSSLDPVLTRVRDGTISVDQGQMDAREIVRRMVYQDSYGANYIFMSAYDGRMLVQPFSPELEGSDQIKLQDIHGKYIIQSLIKAAQLNPRGSFVDYYYPPPNSTVPEQKISYVVGLPEINAYIGAGIYPSQAYRQQQSLLLLLGAISLSLLGLLAVLTVQTIRKVKETSDSIIKQKFAEQNLTSVFNSSHDAILVHDQAGKILSVNSAMLKMYNLSMEDLDGLTVKDISAPASEQRYVIEDIWSRVVSGEDLIFEWISIRPYDQTQLNVEISMSRIVWNENQCILAVIRDITDRIKIQADLQKNEWLLEHAQSLSHIGHYYYELSSRQLTWSKELFRIYGLEPQSVPPSDVSFPHITIEDGRGSTRLFHMGKNQLEEKIATDYQIVRPDGEVRDLILIMDHVRNQENEIIAYAGAIQDVTERRHVANSLRTTTLNLETVLENIPFEIWGFDLEGICTLQNRTAQELWGPLVGKQIDEAGIVGDLKNDWVDTNRRVLSGQGIEKLKTRVIDGKVQHIHAIVSPIIDSDLVIGGLGVNIDITDQVESTLRAQRALEKNNIGRQIDQLILKHHELSSIMQFIVEKAVAILEVDAAAVLIHEPNSAEMKVIAAPGLGDDQIKCPIAPDQISLCRQVVESRKPLTLTNSNGLLLNGFCQCIKPGSFSFYSGWPIFSNQVIVGVLELFGKDNVPADDEWMNFLHLLVGQAAIAFESTRLFSDLAVKNIELSSAYDATIEGWSKALELKDKETKGHSDRVMDLACRLATHIGFPESQMIHFRRGVFLHDIGKMGVPDHILLKGEALTPTEWKVMRQHPVSAYNLLDQIDYLKPSLDIPYCHHERWDGSGYPRQLKGEEIPLAARIFSVVDVWDALVSDRPYRQGWAALEARKYIQKNAGILFDPVIVNSFFELIDT